jgi:hypothetical protein
MWNNEWPVCISTSGLRTLRTRMYDGNVLHCNDVNVETARSKPHRRHAAEEVFKFLDAREHFNGCRGRLFGKCRAHLKCCVEKLWLINKADRCGAIERRDLLHVPARDARECDYRFGERGDRVVEICSDP